MNHGLTCEACGERLIEYHHDELPLKERRRVAEHLTSCSACALEYCRLDADLSGISELYCEQPRPELQQRIRRQVDREFHEPWWRRLARLGTFPVPAYQTALIVLVLVLAWVLLGPPGSPAPGERDAPSRYRDPGATVRPAQTILSNYDASRIVCIDPDLL